MDTLHGSNLSIESYAQHDGLFSAHPLIASRRTTELMKKWQIPRRTFLKGVGTALALPMLDAMVPAFAAVPIARRPLRMAFVYVPNGVNMADWTPEKEGTD